MKLKSKFTSEIVTDNKIFTDNKFNSLYLKNQGADNVRVFDNMILKPNEDFWIRNDADVIFTDNIQIVFEGIETSKVLFVMKIYVE